MINSDKKKIEREEPTRISKMLTWISEQMIMPFNASDLRNTGGSVSVKKENEFSFGMLRQKCLGDIQRQRSGRKREIRT